MTLSACIWALSGPEARALAQIADAGFSHVDIRPGWLATQSLRELARDLGLAPSCIAASAGMPEGASLAGADPGAVAQAFGHIERALEHGASLGCAAAYLVPGGHDRARYADALARLADRAQALGLRLCIEHFPGTMLPTAAGLLSYLEGIGHPNLFLLFDIGHAQISGEDPAQTIRNAGPRLGYVHLNDNDGANDQHLSLLDGILTENALSSAFAALSDIGYTGAVSLELSPNLPDPLEALRQSRETVLRIARK